MSNYNYSLINSNTNVKLMLDNKLRIIYLMDFKIETKSLKLAKTAEWEHPEPTSTNGHTKITTICRATIDKKNWMISRKDLTTR